ncbi:MULTISPECIES: Mbov_0396 family ICE element transmembrane protein [unclassified Mycoplasma]|uniref:Mbov_0396 family ICE element transmembrane protein n=1 Tax=unclassified Mycoplasma TaxID=2683645 RepID=UPI001C10F039|nr:MULTISPECIES: hypothetical protein [unclassified Mycoplasma]MBU4693233.1 hypothetical protein [Mycoplasma sp. CSL7491-lung]MCU4706988.1 hypothetical protein [Mycoplasma sp. CSL7503-lung]
MGFLINWVGWYIFTALWYIFIFLPIWVLHILHSTLEFIALKLPIYIIFGGYKINFQSTFFVRFFTIAVICLIAIVFILIYRLLKSSKSQQNQILLKDALKQTFISFILVIGIPMLIWLFMILFVLVYDAIKTSLILNSSDTIAKYIFKVIEPEWTNNSQGHNAWIQVQNTFNTLSYDDWFNLNSNGILLIIELFIAIIFILKVILNLFIRVVKIVAYQFVYLLWLPPAITQGLNDSGITLKKWLVKFTETILSLFIILIALLLFLFLLETTFKQTPILLDEIINDPSYSPYKKIISVILPTGILIGMSLGLENMIARIMYFFNLNDFAEAPKIKFKKSKNAQQTNNNLINSYANQKNISNDKNFLRKNNQIIISKKRQNSLISTNDAPITKLNTTITSLIQELKGVKNATTKTIKKN